MKTLAIFLLLFAAFQAVGQGKEETEEWFLQTYSEYERAIDKGNKLNFLDGEIFQMIVYGNSCGTWSSYPLKEFKEIVICKEKKGLDDEWAAIYLFYEKSRGLEAEGLNKFTRADGMKIVLDTRFLEAGVQLQVEKVLLHLISLNGGKAMVRTGAF